MRNMILFALLAGSGWAGFILLSRRVVKRISGNDGLAWVGRWK